MISGMKYLDDFVSAELEAELIELIENSRWLDDLKRRVQHYGYKYDYKSRAVDESMFLGPLPQWAIAIGSKLVVDGLFAVAPDQLIVNEYEPGQGISAHVDCEPCFKDTIASITLGSGCQMDFTSVESGEKRSIFLTPRSIVVLTGESRYDWRHAIAGRKSDVVEGKRIARSRRISLTYRNVILKSCITTASNNRSEK